METGISRKDHTTENNRTVDNTFTRLTDLLNWCSENNIILDTRIQLVDDPNFGISVFSKDIPIPAFETLVTIPKTAVLSSRSSSLIRLIPELEVIPYGHGAHLSLALCLYYELLLGPDSRWSGYLRSLPKEPVAIALFWDVQVHAICNSDNELEEVWASPSSTDREKPGECTEFPVLKENPEDGALARQWSVGTEIDREQRTEDGVWLLDELQDYYRNTVLPVFRRLNRIRQFAEPGPSQQSSFSIPQDCHPTLRGYLHAYSLVSSRAFLVDAYHGLSMVPIADAFNHSIPNHVHLESEYDVCVICGSLSQCLHDTDGEGEDSSSSHLPTHSWPNIDPNDTCDMTSNLLIPPRVQIYNTYGENLTNAQLLVRYGFALPSGCNDNDVVSWKFHELPTVESLALPTPQDKRKSSVGDSYQRSGGPPQSALEFPGETIGRSGDLGTALQILLESILRVWPSEARWKESELVFNSSHAHGSEVTNLPLSDSAVDEGGHAAGEDDEDVVLVEQEGGDDINIDVDIKTTVAASVTDRRREDFPESSTTEGYRHQYHRSWTDFCDPDTDSGNDAIQMSTSMPCSVSVSILDAGRVHEKEEGNERHLHLASTRARGLGDHWNGNEDDDDDSAKDGDSRKQVYNGNEGNIGNSGSEKNEKSGESRNIDDIGNIAGISRDDAVAVDRDLDSNGDEDDEEREEDAGRSRTRRERKRIHEVDSDSDGGNDRRRKKKQRTLVKPLFCINGDARLSHHLWVYCALCSLAIVRGIQSGHSHARRTREDHKHEDPFGRPPGHGVDPGSDAPKAELKSSDPIHSNEAEIGSSGGLDALDRLGRAGLGNTDEVVRVLSQVAGRQIVLERWLQQRQQQGEDHEQQQEQQEGEMEVEEELELELDVDVDTGMGAGETLGGDSKGEEGDMPEEEGPAVSVESDSEEGWGEEGDEDEDGEQPAAGVAVEGQDRHQTIGQGSRQGYGGSLGGLDTVKSVNTRTVGDGGPAILTRKVRNDDPATSSRRQSKPVPVEEHESKDAMETLRKEDEVSKVIRQLVRTITSLCSRRIKGTIEPGLRAQILSSLSCAHEAGRGETETREMSMEDMGAVLDSLTSTSTSPEDELDRSPNFSPNTKPMQERRREKTRWAIEQALGERAILESCQYAWVELDVCNNNKV